MNLAAPFRLTHMKPNATDMSTMVMMKTAVMASTKIVKIKVIIMTASVQAPNSIHSAMHALQGEFASRSTL